jgi:hypothetical protein
MCTTVIHIIYERSISFLIILKLCEFSGFQTKLVFILFYIRRAILTQTNTKKDLIEKKTCQITKKK